MPGYQLVERSSLAPEKTDGIQALPNELGLLDFLRELAADEFPFPRMYAIRVVGLDEVLYAAGPEAARLALEIRHRLTAAAQDLERRVVSVQVVIQGKLMRGDRLWVEYRGQELPAGHVFGSPPPQTDANGNHFFRANFNLTSA
jgi:hypothetical protein